MSELQINEVIEPQSPIVPQSEVLAEPSEEVDISELRAHEMTRNYPSISGDESGNLINSISKLGILQKVTVWKDPQTGKFWVIDGRSRLNAYNLLIKDGVELTEQGKALTLPMEEFVGTISQAFAYVHEKNFVRRHMSSSQRAAVIIKKRLMQQKYLKRDGLPQDGVYKSEGETLNQFAERLGTESGTNRQYLFNCARIAEIDPKFLDFIISGEKVVNEVLAAALRKQAGKDPWPTASDSTGETENVSGEEKDLSVKDGFKRDVAEKFHKFFKVRDRVRDTVKNLKKVIADVEAIAAGEGGDHYDGTGMSQSLTTVLRELVNAQPHAVCPKCSGSGREATDGGTKKCTLCGGAKFISKAIFNQMPQELKDVVVNEPAV